LEYARLANHAGFDDGDGGGVIVESFVYAPNVYVTDVGLGRLDSDTWRGIITYCLGGRYRMLLGVGTGKSPD
jgi:hypothetical protein